MVLIESRLSESICYTLLSAMIRNAIAYITNPTYILYSGCFGQPFAPIGLIYESIDLFGTSCPFGKYLGKVLPR